MINSSIFTSATFTTITFVLLSVLVFSVFLLYRRLQILDNKFNKSAQSSKKLATELNATMSGAIGLGQRLLSIEKQIKELKSRHQDILSFGNDDKHQKRTYKQASQLAQMGASIDELKHSCELSQGEAELLSHMSSQHTH